MLRYLSTSYNLNGSSSVGAEDIASFSANWSQDGQIYLNLNINSIDMDADSLEVLKADFNSFIDKAIATAKELRD